MSTSAELRQARKIRASILGLLTREKKKLFDDSGTLMEAEILHMDDISLKVMLNLIEDHYARFVQIDERVLALECSADNADNDYDDEALISDTSSKFYSDYSLLKSTILRLSHDDSKLERKHVAPQSKSIRLPKLEVPKFSGDYTSWLDFKNEFESMIIQNTDLNDVDRFRFLKSSLTDGPKRIISSMEISQENFAKAWKALSDRYDNVGLIFRSHINKLMSLQVVSGSTSEKYRELLDAAQSHLRSLLSLGSEVNIAENIIICLLLSKIDSKAQAKWEETSTNDISTWEQFASFLEKYASTLEKVDQTRQQCSRPLAETKKVPFSKKTPSLLASTSSQSSKCPKCQAPDHTVTNCGIFLSMSPHSRYLDVKQWNRCLRCLATHSPRTCKAKCRKCKGNHHTLLHFGNQSPTATPTTVVNPTPIVTPTPQLQTPSTSKASKHEAPPINPALMAPGIRDNDKALLASALILVRDESKNLVPCHALLDSGSTDNYISERLVKAIGVKRFKYATSNEVGGIGGTSAHINSYTDIELTSQDKDHTYNIRVNILPRITEVYPAAAFEVQSWNIPPTVQLADPHFNVPKKIDLLIGAGLFWSLLKPNRIVLGPSLPYLQETELGFIVAGAAPSNAQTRQRSFHVNCENSDESLNQLVVRFWEMDSIPETHLTLSPQDQQCEEHFHANTVRDSTGRYVVRLPFRDDPKKLGKSIDIAMKRFLNLERKLDKQPQLKQQYSEFIKEYESLGHLEVVNDFNFTEPHFFIPHHCVIKPTSSTTKLRVVFDASCKTTSGFSLNDLLHTGPQLQDDLFTILLRFRLYKYVATSDIQKMYRQIRVDPRDTNYQLILWRENSSDPLKILRLLTVTYGTGPGAYLAIKSLRQLASDEGKGHIWGANIILNNFYVDDVLLGAHYEGELEHKLEDLKSILRLGGFKLGKYCSNSLTVLQAIPPELQEKYLKINEHDVIKTLGIMWQPDSDVFRYTHEVEKVTGNVTKRLVLSRIAKIFDPLGFVCPVVTLAKIFYQSLWKLNIDWDDPLPDDLTKKWNLFDSQLSSLRDVLIPRFVFKENFFKRFELHGFSDASEKAYGACVYVRCIHCDDSVSVRLLCAKSRVAPTKIVTIARLELCAAKMLVDLVQKLKSNFVAPFEIKKIYFWTDSAIVLHWLSVSPHNWSIYVAHRVTKIQEYSSRLEWRHLPGSLNPADIISRGLLPSEVSKSSLWWHGPSFLFEMQKSWPEDIVTPRLLSEVEEFRPMKMSFLTIKKDDLTSNMRFSLDFRGTRRAFAYALRFIERCKKPALSKNAREAKLHAIEYSQIDSPSLEEELVAEETFIKNIQQSAFHTEYQSLSTQRQLQRSSTLIKLSPFIDSVGLVRVGGRLKRAHIPFDAKHQILLPRNHRFTRSIITYFHHKRVCHAGPQTTITAIRERYWPIGALQLTRHVIHNCIWCFRLKPKFATQIMAHLPSERVEPLDYRPFAVSGVDFAGPIPVRHHIRCKQNKEVHLALFICFVTKAIHVELVTDLSTEAFLRALSRFIADRGKVSKIYSDNARNFIGACNYLKSIKQMLVSSDEKIKSECNKSHIDWSFIPPRAPHHGGLWEASVKLLKRLIKNIVGKANLTEDELRTVSKRACAIVNSRPISTLSADPNDVNPLTPGHFMFGSSPAALPDPPADFSRLQNVNQVHLFQRMQYVSQLLWSRFYKEYLNLLQPRSKWFFENNSFVPGTLVLLKEQDPDPLSWKLGRILDTTPDSNGIVRIIRVKTATGEYDRAINGVAVLPDELQPTIVDKLVNGGEGV